MTDADETPQALLDMGAAEPVAQDSLDMPATRAFRDAWQLDGQVVAVDMTRARAIHRDTLRRQRAPRFAPYDDIIRPLDRKRVIGDLTQAELDAYAAAEAACQQLRDVTEDPRIDQAETPEALAALTLDALLGEGV